MSDPITYAGHTWPSARDWCLWIMRHNAAPSPAQNGQRAALDAYRTEVLAKAIGRLRAIPVDCTALTGPVWYGDGWNSAITQLEEIADYQTPDDEKFPGELDALRALVGNLRGRVRGEDWDMVRWLLDAHRERETSAGAATADFFEPGRSYTSTGPRDVWLRFVCEHVTRDPQTGVREAWGWLHRADGTRRMERAWESSYPQWTVEAGDGRG
ncbi:hypothetical protein [Streptomyces caniscabiei]|uniref:hypothetical protein n=1 Tax=Streptomyces caniscabiei TaxID=2746961 RepID=UPI0029AAD470|nr:hypothetical protein [Streptomyces caniscabiei]MDX2954543.1 hypothetical protein [Streptomyces caniscabiei]